METIVITGPSGTGKTFLANKLSKDFKSSIILNTDSYYRDNLFIKFLSVFMHDIYDRLISIRKKDLLKTIESIYFNEKKIILYNYDFRTKKSTQIISKKQNKIQLLIIEGVFSHRINFKFKSSLNILCNENKEICYKRRLKRDQLERGRNKKEVKRKFKRSWDLYYKHLTTYIKQNDIYEVNTKEKMSYDKLINKIKTIYSNKKTKANN